MCFLGVEGFGSRDCCSSGASLGFKLRGHSD